MLQVTARTLATLIKDRTDLMFAVGSGVDGWNDLTPPKFPDDRPTLFNETLRMPIKSITYVDPATFADSPVPTNVLKIVGEVSATSPIDGTFIREKAIFVGGDTKDSGMMLHAETTSKDTKVNGKSFETTFIVTIKY
jgi:hypothetical protein